MEADADRAGHARRLAGRSAHPEHIVVAPLDIEGMVIHQAVHDFIRLRTAVKDVADDVEMINNEPLNQLCHGDDEVFGAADFEDGLDDRLVVCFFIEHLRLFGDQLLDDIRVYLEETILQTSIRRYSMTLYQSSISSCCFFSISRRSLG